MAPAQKESPIDLRALASSHGQAVEGGPAASWVSVDALIPWAENPRFNDEAHVAEVRASIKAFGFGPPVIGNARTGELVCGHTRILAARAEGMTLIPVRLLDLSVEDAEALALADNRLNETGRWDESKQAEILRRHAESDRERLRAAGFDDKATRSILRKANRVQKTPPHVDDIPAEPKTPITKPGDLWLLGPHRLLCADAFVPENRERLLEGKRVDAILMDPPYAIYGSSTGIGADIADDKMVRPFFEQMFRATHGAIKEFGHAYVCCDWRSFAAIVESARRGAMTLKNCIVWDKGGSGLGGMYANTHEFIGFFARLPPAKTMTSGMKRGQRGVYGSNIVRFPRPRGDERQHNAAKPVDMFRLFIENSTEEGESVLDMFSGSGTTIMACETSGRVGRGFELEPKFCDVIVARWEKLTGKKADRVADKAA